jgi:hypothetical protein
MGDPTPTPTPGPERIAKLAAAVRKRVDASSDHSARISRYRTADGTEREVVIVKNADADWEVHDRDAADSQMLENVGDALEEAIPVALEYLRDCEQRAVRARAAKIALAVARQRAARAGNRDSAPLPSRRAA